MRRVLLAALLALSAGGAAAQNPEEPDLAQVRELLSLSGTEKQYEQVLDVVRDAIREDFSQGFIESVREKSFDAEKQHKAQAIAGKHLQEVLDSYAEEIRRVMPYERLVVEVYAPLYRKYFTRAQLEDAIAFFKSPSGRKFSETAPLLVQDSARAVTQRYMPMINRRMAALMRERMEKMADEIGKL